MTRRALLAEAPLLVQGGYSRSPRFDILHWKASLLPCGEAARDICRPAAQGRLRADGVLAEVDGAGTLRTCDVLGERDRSRPRRGSVAATLDPGPQIENLPNADLDRAPRRLGLHEVERRNVPAPGEGGGRPGVERNGPRPDQVEMGRPIPPGQRPLALLLS